jgi:patatin-like phospholipase
MNYLLDIAKLVLPAVRTCRLRQDPGAKVLRVIDRVCHRVLAARRICRKRHSEGDQHRAARVAPPPTAGPGAPETDDVQPALLTPSDVWAKTCDAEAADVIADVLARFPDRIPRVLSAIGCADYYPSYLEYLLETVIEVAQPNARINSKGLFAWIKARFIPAEYAALLRDRHPIVAEVLSEADCGRRLIEISRTQSPPAAPRSSGLATAHMFGAGGLAVARDIGRRVAAQRRATPAEATSPNNDWQVVAQALASSPESIGDCLRSALPNRRQAFVCALRADLLVKPALVLKLAEVTGAAAPFGLVFAAELDEIQASRARRVKVVTDPPTRYPPARASDMKLFGLALSGGGIRSATFNLGILQGLAQLGMLREIDYLSTVSGGGYIAAWLAAWIKRASIEDACGGPKTGVCAVEELLRAEPLPTPDARSVHPLRFLREYSNYLTPQTGFFSADTWTMVTIWVRNTLLNQMVLVLAVAAALLVPWNVWFWLTVDLPDRSTGLLQGCGRQMGFSALLLWTGAWIAGSQLRRFNLPPADREKRCADMLGQGGVVLRIVTPAVIACAVLARVIFEARAELGANGAFRQRAFFELFGLFIVCHGIVSIRGEYWKCFLAERLSGAKRRWTNRMLAAQAGFIITLAGVIGAGAGAGLAVLAGIVLGRFGDAPLPMSQHWVVLGVPTMTVIMSLMIVMKLGVLGRNLYDEHREWWSRVGAWLIIVSLAWLVIFGFAIYSPFLTALAASEGRKWIMASGGVAWTLWTVAGVLLGKDDKHAPGLRAALTSSSARKWIVLLAPYVFVAGLLVLVSTAAYSLVAWNLPSAANADAFTMAHWSGRGRVCDWLPASVPLLALLAYLLSWRVDINEFSMHHFYKNRLVRCYLGASRGSGKGPTRSPDPFTGFDRSDEVPFADLRMEPGGADPELRRVLAKEGRADKYVGPLPIVNVALNLVKGDDLAWQERKAQSFAFTPLYCGYEHRQEERHDDRSGDASTRTKTPTTSRAISSFAKQRSSPIGRCPPG